MSAEAVTLPAVSRLERRGLIAALTLALLLMIPVRGYLTDDTFIHLQYARHLAEGRGMEFNPGERVYGCTSPLWVALLADAMALGLDGVAAARGLGAIATLVSVVLFFQLLRRTVATPELRVAGTVAWAAHAWMARWSLSGMETPVAVALTLAGFVAFVSGPAWGSRPARVAVWWSLAALTRPELVLLLALWGALLLVEVSDRSLRRRVAGVTPVVVIYGGWLLYARLHFHAWWPQTLAAKAAGSASLAFQLDNLWRQARVLGSTDVVVAVLALLGLGWALRGRDVAAGPVARALPWLWVVGLPASYLVRGVPVLSRYLLILAPILAWLAWRTLDAWWTRGDRRPAAAWGMVVAGLIVAQNLVVYRAVVVPQVTTFTSALERELIPWGRWFGDHSPPQATIATPDIGVLGYFSRRRVLDLAGLVSPRMVRYLTHESQEEVIAHFRFATFARPEYLVDRGGGEYRLLRDSPYAASLTPLGLARLPNLGVARPGPAIYSFYRIDWNAYDSLRVAHGR